MPSPLLRRPLRRLPVPAALAAIALGGAPSAAAGDAACRSVFAGEVRYDSARRTCLARRVSQVDCAQMPGHIRWHRDQGHGADVCEYAVPSGIGGSGTSRLPPDHGRNDPEGAPPGCAEAKLNVDWVLFRDAGAWRSYSHARRTQAPLASLLHAQRHNRRAQESIRRCAGWAAAYAARIEANGRRPDDAGAPPESPVRYGAIAIADRDTWNGRTPALGVAVGHATQAQANAAALLDCRRLAPRCNVPLRWQFTGCLYAATGSDLRGNVRVGHGATAFEATRACTTNTVICGPPRGGCNSPGGR